MENPAYLKLGEMLVKERLVTVDQLEQAMLVQKKEGGRIGEVLVRLGMVSEADYVQVLAKQLNMPYASLGSDFLKPALDQELENLVPREFALKNIVLPLSRNLDSLTCAVYDPFDLTLLDNLKQMTGCQINLVIASRTDILRMADSLYGKSNLLQQAVTRSYSLEDKGGESEVESIDSILSIDRLIASAEDAPVVKLVDLIISQAIDERASDIHIEPYRDKIRLRYRIDGKLYDVAPPAKHLHISLVSRIKILSKLDIAEKRIPQDGAFRVNMGDRLIDLRVSIIPVIFGEKAVLRILDRSRVEIDLPGMGFEPKQLEAFRKGLSSAYGLVFLTGPTGSGKTTTLYAALNEIKDPTKNIVTVEDPIEYSLFGINQLQVKQEIGLSFASALRAFLRQDPDIILVGEVRDAETADICIRSALTGHLVLSTLHTNDASSAISRLMDIGIEPYLLVPSLLVVVAQRLVRRLCPDCKEAYEPLPEQISRFNLRAELIYRSKGCNNCNRTGYLGRMLIAEVMTIDNHIRELIGKRADSRELRKAAIQSGMESLLDSGVKKVEKGITSLSEVLSVVGAVE